MVGMGVLMLLVSCAWMATASVIALFLPRGGAVGIRAEAGDWRLLLRSGPYLRLLGVTLATYVCLQGPLVMFPMFVRSLGGDLETVSRMWIWMLAFEIPLLAGVAAAPAWVGARELIGIGIAADSLRWLVCAWSPSLVWTKPRKNASSGRPTSTNCAMANEAKSEGSWSA